MNSSDNNTNNSNSMEQPISNERSDFSYRLVNKKFHCHQCNKDFKKMAPAEELVEILCPACESPFVEEVTQNQSENNSMNSSLNSSRSNPASPPMSSSNQNNRSRDRETENIFSRMFGFNVSPQRQQPQVPEHRPSGQRYRIIREITTDMFGNQTIVERIIPVAEEQPRQQQFYQAGPNVMFINSQPQFSFYQNPFFNYGPFVPQGLFMQNFGMNFRSGMTDDILQQVIRLSEQERGRSGNPPASKEVIEKLPEVQIDEKYCKKNDQTGEVEQPRCAICCDDLTEKATLLPCGHLFNKECINKWLNEHNQCPVCRHELKTDDNEYEKMREQRSAQVQQNQVQ